MSSPGTSGNVRLALAVLAIGAAVMGLHAYRYMPFLCDDALISLRYARRFLDGHGLTWNTGERVEGYSNLLWILSTAALGSLGVDLVTSTRILGVAGMVLAMAAVVYAFPPASLAATPVAGIAVLFLAASSAFAVWAIGGMEQPLVAALLAWAVVLCFPHLESRRPSIWAMQGPGLCLALLCLTRPDSPLFTAAAVLAVVLVGGARRDALVRGAALATLPVIFTLGQLAFRLGYYGEWVPNTALVKLDPSGGYALDGWRYIARGGLTMAPLLALAAAAAVISFRRGFERARMTLIIVLALAWTAYVVVIGGDIFPAWRHFVPLFVLLALMVAIGGEWIRRHASRRQRAAAAAAAVIALAVFSVLQWRDWRSSGALTERWEWDGQVLGTMLKRAFGARQPLLAVDAAGALPYWSELPTVDMLGLNDHYLPRHPPTDGQTIGIGHDLGDGRYVLGRSPDIVVFGIATGGEHAFFRSAREMHADPRFAAEYTLVTFEGTDPYTVQGKFWIKRHSERIGITRSADRIAIPGFLMNDRPNSVARIGRDGGMVLPLSPAAPAHLDAIDLPAGRWQISADATSPLRIEIRPTQRASHPLLEADLPALLDVRREQRVSITATPTTPGPAELSQLALTRRPD
jgi:hypothetical protein